MTLKKCIACIVLIWISINLIGCSHLGVKPWEREILAKDGMDFNANAVDLALDDHIYFSKEGTSGGRGFAGGGCGCN